MAISVKMTPEAFLDFVAELDKRLSQSQIRANLQVRAFTTLGDERSFDVEAGVAPNKPETVEEDDSKEFFDGLSGLSGVGGGLAQLMPKVSQSDGIFNITP